MTIEDRLDASTLRPVCEKLVDGEDGLSHTNLKRHLDDLEITDPYPSGNKRDRLHEALVRGHGMDGPGSRAKAFIEAAMRPARFISDTPKFERLRLSLNHVLIFVGLSVGADGKLHEADETAETIPEAEALVGRMQAELKRRNVHPDVLAACSQEILHDGNPFHAILEATKSVADKIRRLSGSVKDGHPLVDEVFPLSGAGPVLAFNTLADETDRSEHTGFVCFARGLFSAFRNPQAHNLRVHSAITEPDALDVLTLASYLHRQLDVATLHPGGRRLGPPAF